MLTETETYKPTLLTIKPAVYLLIVSVLVAGSYGYRLRIQGIFACPADGYSDGRYLAYCNAVGYGDYDHGAFWLDLEPEARSYAGSSDVLFLGSSRMQFAFSSPSTASWFEAFDYRYYLLGFSHTENVTFTGPLLSALAPEAKAYVINVDRIFDDRVSPPASVILSTSNVEEHYRAKKHWQYPHRAICTALPIVCGSQYAFFRSPANGDWVLRGAGATGSEAVSDGPASDEDQWQHYVDIAEEFVAALPVERRCVFLTLVPSVATKSAEARVIAMALGLDLVAPEVPNLRTFDGSHLDPASADSWSEAFFGTVGPKIHECLRERPRPL